METVYIYGLFDPRNGELRYIGKTIQLKMRLEKHIREAKNYLNHNTRKERWIRELLSNNLKPAIIALEECTRENWQDREREWIRAAREICVNLVNLADGGKGPSWGERHPGYGIPRRQDVKDKISQANKGKTKGEKHPLYGGGDKFTPEHRKNMSISARNKPPIKDETRVKMRESYLAHIPPNRGRKWTDSYKAKMSELSKGKPKSDNHNKKNSLAVAMMWSKRKGNYQRISELQKEYFNLFRTYNQKYIEYI